MKNTIVALGLLSLVFLVGCLRPSEPSAVTLIPHRSEIVVAPDASPVVKFAAQELNGQLARVFGRPLDVVTNPTPDKTSIFLGDNAWSRAAGIDVKPLARDAFVIRAEGSRVYIAGRDDPKRDIGKDIARGNDRRCERATVFGVYEFLERFAGVRFYFPGELGTVAPSAAFLRVPTGETRVAPTFIVRNVLLEGVPGSQYGDGAVPDQKSNADCGPWKALQRTRMRMDTDSIPCCHGQREFTFPDRFTKTHPEYFALTKRDGGTFARDLVPDQKSAGELYGHLCHSSKVWDEMYEDCKAYLTGKSAESRGIRKQHGKGFGWNRNCHGRFIDVMPQDYIRRCWCPDCLKVCDTNSTMWATELIWGQTAKLARRLSADGLDAIVTQMAYENYRSVPKCDLPSNVWVMVAETGPWGLACPQKTAAEIDEVRRWTEKLGHPIWMWTYPSKYGPKAYPGLPDVAPRAWSDYYRRTMPYSYGGFCESETEKSVFHYLNYYAFSRIAWHPEEKIEDILAEHHRLMFGAAAPEMASFYDGLEEKWTKGVVGRWNMVDGKDPEMCLPNDHRVWNELYTPEVLKGWAALFDRAAAKLDAGSLEAKRVAFVRREFLDHILAAEAKFRKATDVAKARTHFAALKPGENVLPTLSEPLHLTTEKWYKYWTLEKEMALKPNTRYRFSCVFRTKGLKARATKPGSGLRFAGWYGQWFDVPGGERFSGTLDWTYRAYEFTTPDSINTSVRKCYIGPDIRGAEGEAWVECIALEELGLPLVPQPKSAVRTEGEFTLKAQGDIRWAADAKLPKEGYRLVVSRDGVKASYADAAGRLYALQTLRQLAGDTCRDALKLTCPATLPCCRIEDAPKFPWRGYMLDTSRHFFGTDVIKRALDTMAYHKLNVFHWHLADCAGWRFPVSAYPALTNACATRTNGKRTAAWGRNEQQGQYGPFFHSRADIAEILAYAKARGIEVVPEIDIPGHQGINGQFKFACCQSGLKPVGTNKWHGATGDMCVGNPEAYRFYEKVFDELCEAFPSKVIHIGGDEVGGKDWKICPRCQEIMRKRGLKNQRELQNVVMRHFADYLAKKGRRAIGWDEILEGGAMPDGTMMTHFHSGGTAHLTALAAGHDVVMMPGHATYFDFEQDIAGDPYDIYQIFNSRLSWKRAYGYDPCEKVPEKDRAHVLGLQGCSWTEIVCNERELDWGVHPRLACLAEIGWSYPGKRDVEEFGRRLSAHRERLVKMGVNAAPLGPLVPAVPAPEPKPAVLDLKGFVVVFAPQLTEEVVEWTQDATVPAGGYAAEITAKPYYAPGKVVVLHSDAAGKALALKVLKQLATPKDSGVLYMPKGKVRSY